MKFLLFTIFTLRYTNRLLSACYVIQTKEISQLTQRVSEIPKILYLHDKNDIRLRFIFSRIFAQGSTKQTSFEETSLSYFYLLS